MIPITKMQFWKLEHKIDHNYSLSICGTMYLSRDINGSIYKDAYNQVWAKHDKTGWWCDSRLLAIIDQ